MRFAGVLRVEFICASLSWTCSGLFRVWPESCWEEKYFDSKFPCNLILLQLMAIQGCFHMSCIQIRTVTWGYYRTSQQSTLFVTMQGTGVIFRQDQILCKWRVLSFLFWLFADNRYELKLSQCQGLIMSSSLPSRLFTSDFLLEE